MIRSLAQFASHFQHPEKEPTRKRQWAYFKGFANTRWPKVTKLVSWLDINEAKDETLNVEKN